MHPEREHLVLELPPLIWMETEPKTLELTREFELMFYAALKLEIRFPIMDNEPEMT